MRDQIIMALGQMLHANIGNKLTNELATGIATSLNQMLMQAEGSKGTPDQGGTAESPAE